MKTICRSLPLAVCTLTLIGKNALATGIQHKAIVAETTGDTLCCTNSGWCIAASGWTCRSASLQYLICATCTVLRPHALAIAVAQMAGLTLTTEQALLCAKVRWYWPLTCSWTRWTAWIVHLVMWTACKYFENRHVWLHCNRIECEWSTTNLMVWDLADTLGCCEPPSHTMQWIRRWNASFFHVLGFQLIFGSARNTQIDWMIWWDERRPFMSHDDHVFSMTWPTFMRRS